MKIEANRIDNENAASLLQAGEAALQQGDSAFDLSAVQHCDSAAVALLLAWQRAAQARSMRLELHGVPVSLRSLAALYGVEALLAVQ